MYFSGIIDRYLTGMGFFLLLHSIAVTVAIPFPSQYKELSIIETAIASCTRAALLDFYSFPPSNAIILAMRRYFFPRSLRSKSFFPSNSVPYTSSGHFELGMQSKQSDEVGMV
ncbi:hypothetical protein BC938DRAFT_472278 [Jimgerdemannia flammicorona]|uniref:Uncharacterized protein n=1 Tax=Jimgerdemannia flammicorona TaxID=994334 RepID=A0A433QU01_9FUNG|nr:hypothetical protein BC938DRAFT_472278 [Jimgerdemannia flammicorona]